MISILDLIHPAVIINLFPTQSNMKNLHALKNGSLSPQGHSWRRLGWLCLQQSELLGMYATDGQQVLVLTAWLTESTPPLPVHSRQQSHHHNFLHPTLQQVSQINLLSTMLSWSLQPEVIIKLSVKVSWWSIVINALQCHDRDSHPVNDLAYKCFCMLNVSPSYNPQQRQCQPHTCYLPSLA